MKGEAGHEDAGIIPGSLKRERRVIARPGNPESAPDTEVLVLFGSKDIYGTTAERLCARYPDARHVILENAGHLPWLQSPDTFRAGLCAFFG